jgi:pyrimidine-nucleoside phosphorylase
VKFNSATLIKKKREGEELTTGEIEFLINGFTEGAIPDYAMSAFLMATYFKGMTANETAALVECMKNSGAVVDSSKIKLPKVDKHSTGGIGDKPTLILVPLLAACGVVYPTMCGRGLGHTGGTADKLEAIPGFNTRLTIQRFQDLLSSVGAAFLSQTEEICPADRKLYALRDVTATVESTPLIVGSIMSKKLAEGCDAIVFDVKVGSGAFMKTEKQAIELSRALVDTGRAANKVAYAMVTDMSQPLGHAVGNAIEVNECVAMLRHGANDSDPEPRLKELTLALAEKMLAAADEVAGKKPQAKEKYRERLLEALESGAAYAKFLEIVSLQGGDTEAVDDGLPLAPKKLVLESPSAGFVTAFDGEAIGMALVELGGGRKKTSDKIDPSVGFHFHRFLGDKVSKGTALVDIYARDAKAGQLALEMLQSAITVGKQASPIPSLIRQVI